MVIQLRPTADPCSGTKRKVTSYQLWQGLGLQEVHPSEPQELGNAADLAAVSHKMGRAISGLWISRANFGGSGLA